jgi:hypothetical protein
MKPMIMLIVVLGSVAAGGAGGFVASKLAEPPKVAPRVETASDPATDYSADFHSRDQRLDELQRTINQISVRLEKAEQRTDSGNLLEELQKLEARTARLEKGVVTGEPEAGATVETTELKSTFKELMKQHEEEERAEQLARREKQMAAMTEDRRKAIMTKLVEGLHLTTEQQSKVDTLVADYQTKRREVWTRSMQARETGEQFDMRAEMQTIETAAQDSIRAALLAGQVTTFNELVGEGRIEDLGGGRGWGNRGGNRNNRQD